jgi:hypothetical protein
MRLGNIIANFLGGVPVTLIAILAFVILGVWLVGGVGSKTRRLLIGLPYLAALILGWGILLVRPADGSREDGLMWVTYAMTALAFIVPLLWRRLSKRHE